MSSRSTSTTCPPTTRSIRSRSRRDRGDERDRQLGRTGPDRVGDHLPDLRARLPGALLMSWQAIVQFLLLAVALAVTVPVLGRYMANVYGARADGSAPGDRVFNPVERLIYRICRVDPKREQRWNVYAMSLL